MSIIIANKYIITEKIGEGSFGSIFKGFHKDNKNEVAVKIEKNHKGLLRHEADIYHSLKHIKIIPKMRLYGKEGKYSYLILDLLYKPLSFLITAQGGNFTLKTVLMIIIKILNGIQSIHKHHIVHRDIKPDNFMIGSKNTDHNIYLIDFGLSRFYYTEKTHIEYRQNKGMIGTPRYASLNTHKGIEYSRRDDMESLGYLFIFLLRGKLPWQGLQINKRKQKLRKIYEIKKIISLMIFLMNLIFI